MAASEPNPLVGQRFASQFSSDRRGFLKDSAALTVGFSALCGVFFRPEAAQAADSGPNVLGPRPGYSPQVGTFVALLTWMREANGVISATGGSTACVF
ncbi:MAG TPA: hypothetical protein VKR60_11675 [Candidatus Sulfotelmatobacter sp.]|nr:hypothetical protein [Candidatus Sulfotelmatobacter sp.]